MLIDSASNKKIKLMESLRLRKHRAKEGLFRIEGVRLAERRKRRAGPFASASIRQSSWRSSAAGLSSKRCRQSARSTRLVRL